MKLMLLCKDRRTLVFATFSTGSTLTAVYRHTFQGSGPDDFAAENCFYQAGGMNVQYAMQ